MVGPTMNLINETYHSCERREYAFMILREYTIISHEFITGKISIESKNLFLKVYKKQVQAHNKAPTK